MTTVQSSKGGWGKEKKKLGTREMWTQNQLPLKDQDKSGLKRTREENGGGGHNPTPKKKKLNPPNACKSRINGSSMRSYI